jgi:DNA-binding Lrp family transcriptional regulator
MPHAREISGLTISKIQVFSLKGGNIMAKAIVLIKSNPGFDREVAGQIKEIEGVENVYLAAGRFDIVAEVQTPDDAGMLSVTYDKIRVIDGIRDTHTMFCLKV